MQAVRSQLMHMHVHSLAAKFMIVGSNITHDLRVTYI
jgi:hypothetical protein